MDAGSSVQHPSHFARQAGGIEQSHRDGMSGGPDDGNQTSQGELGKADCKLPEEVTVNIVGQLCGSVFGIPGPTDAEHINLCLPVAVVEFSGLSRPQAPASRPQHLKIGLPLSAASTIQRSSGWKWPPETGTCAGRHNPPFCDSTS
jgi:hypothetical protein